MMAKSSISSLLRVRTRLAVSPSFISSNGRFSIISRGTTIEFHPVPICFNLTSSLSTLPPVRLWLICIALAVVAQQAAATSCCQGSVLSRCQGPGAGYYFARALPRPGGLSHQGDRYPRQLSPFLLPE